MMKKISINILNAYLKADFEAGTLIWRPRHICSFLMAKNPQRMCASWNGRYANKPALTADNGVGYKWGSISNSLYLTHRVLYAMFHGHWPEIEIDHINHDRSDNSISNLREVSHSENCKNTSLRKSSKSGITGVCWHKAAGKWWAQTVADGVHYHIGLFEDKDEAANAVAVYRRQLGFSLGHGAAL